MARRLVTLCVTAFFLSTSARAEWIAAQGGQIPPNVIIAGQNSHGQPLHVCRAQYDGGIFPGTLVGNSAGCNISYNGTEYSISEYEVLAGNGYSWVTVYNGEIPFDAMRSGKKHDGKYIYICRGDVNSSWYPGNISKSDNACSVTSDGQVLKAAWYEVLVGN